MTEEGEVIIDVGDERNTRFHMPVRTEEDKEFAIEKALEILEYVREKIEEKSK